MRRLSIGFATMLGCFSDQPTPSSDDGTSDTPTSGAMPSTSTPFEATDGPGPGESTAATESSGDEGERMCGAYSSCIVVPPGWAGPYATALEDADCPDEAADRIGTLHADLQPGFDCGCTCGEASGTCTANLWQVGGDPECTTPFAESPLVPGQCAGFDESTWCGLFTDATAQGGCPPSPPANAPTIAWERAASLCIPQDPIACGSGTCIPQTAAPFDRVCIVRDGIHECPAEFITRSTWYIDASDTRECTCLCESPTGVDCELNVSIYNDTACSDHYYDHMGATCHHGVDNTSWSLQWNPTNAGSCTPQQNITGRATPTGPRTLCCR